MYLMSEEIIYKDDITHIVYRIYTEHPRLDGYTIYKKYFDSDWVYVDNLPTRAKAIAKVKELCL